MDDLQKRISELEAQNATLRTEVRKSAMDAVSAGCQAQEAWEAQKAAEAVAETLRGALDRIGKAWPIVRDADCSGGTLASAIEEIDAALTTEADND